MQDNSSKRGVDMAKEITLEKRYFANEDEWQYMIQQLAGFGVKAEKMFDAEEVTALITVHNVEASGE